MPYNLYAILVVWQSFLLWKPSSIAMPNHSVEIDIVGLQDKKVVLAGSAKWGRRVPSSELGRLRRAVESLPNRSDQVALMVFGREKVEAMDALTFSARDLYVEDSS